MLNVVRMVVKIRQRTIVKDVSLSLDTGDTYCLLGPNGAGKTTTLRGIVGALPIASGVVRVGPFDLRTQAVRAKRILGYIPDDGWLFRNVTGQQYLVFIGKLRGLPEYAVHEVIDRLSDRFDVGDSLSQPIEDLSRGTQQKIAMIAGLMHNPQLVVMDEPLTALDPLVTREVVGAIRKMSNDGITFLIATHLLPFAEEVASHIGVLSQGEMVLQGPVEEVKTHYGASALEGVLAHAVANSRR